MIIKYVTPGQQRVGYLREITNHVESMWQLLVKLKWEIQSSLEALRENQYYSQSQSN